MISKYFVKSILSIAFCLLNTLLLAQQDNCAFYVETIRKKNKAINTSNYPLDFAVSETLKMAMRFSDNGAAGVYLTVKFIDQKGYPVELGNILTLDFADGGQSAFMLRSKRMSTSTATFTLWQATSELAPDNSNEARCQRLCHVNITSISLTADYEIRKIQVLQTQSEIIRKIIQCLVQKESLN